MDKQENFHSHVSEPIVISHGSKHSGVKNFFKVLLLLLLLAGLGGLGYLYFVSSGQVNKLEAEKLSLSDQLAAKDKQIAELKGGGGESGNSCASGASYQAEIGKFKVSLEDPYVLVKNVDGNYEGAPATVLEVASCIDDENNVFDKPTQREVKISAYSGGTVDSLVKAHESNYGASISSESITIDGVSGKKNTYENLNKSTSVFFEKGENSYQIDISNASDETNAILEDITSDWKFVAP